ncbi:zinc finger protein 862-like [Mercenaria mercenaria]|uniref:zinc finger protein 862-like n=1 Tax=Mercenaria mercenaria TaxID=6596 RepID=UPI00234F4768|nr:zinc finger protein 862-like [Mercenaria mercenaria]
MHSAITPSRYQASELVEAETGPEAWFAKYLPAEMFPRTANVYSNESLLAVVVKQIRQFAQGVSQLSDLKVDSHTTYEHNTSIGEFQDCLADVLREDLLVKVKQSGIFSLMFDESMDVSVHQNLISYIRVLETNDFGTVEPHTYFLGINQLNRANSESIFGKVLEMLGKKGIDISNLCGVSTDGAAVMVGNKSGVVTRLKNHVPGVLATHCIAHRLALSCSTGADTIPYLVKFQEILNSIYKYFKYSPKNMSSLSAIQSILQGQAKRFQEVFHTRWLSFEGSVDALVTNYPSLISVFLEENSGKALSLYKPITTYKFLYVAHFLCDVLKPLAILSKMYQKKDLQYSEVSPLLTSPISMLEDLRDSKSGERLQGFLKVAPAEPTLDSDGLFTFEFEGHTIRDSEKQRTESVNVCDQFVDRMVKSLNDRFSDNADGAILTSMSNMFNPLLKATGLSNDLETISDYLGSVGIEGSKSELSAFVQFARATHDSGNRSVTDTHSCANLAIKNKSVFPASAEVAERFLALPVSTADCERGFSKQNLIKTSLRSKICEDNLENLMILSVDGPEISKFDYKRAFNLWGSKKQRRILK